MVLATSLSNLDAVIVTAYLLLTLIKRDCRIIVILLPMLMYTVTFKQESPLDDFYAYSLYSAIDITITYYFLRKRQFVITIPIILMSIYCFVFALDSYLNSSVETWIWRNHENIIVVLHSFILFSFSKTCGSLVDTVRSHCFMLRSHNIRADNGEDYNGRQQSEARNP